MNFLDMNLPTLVTMSSTDLKAQPEYSLASKLDWRKVGRFLSNEWPLGWPKFILLGDDENNKQLLRKHARTCRPLGSEAFLAELENKTGRILHKRKPGPKMNN